MAQLRPGLKKRFIEELGETDVQDFRNATQLLYQVTNRGAFGLFSGYRINQCKHSSRDPTRLAKAGGRAVMLPVNVMMQSPREGGGECGGGLI